MRLPGSAPAAPETDTVVHLGMALDLTLLVPLYAAAAVLLWRRAPWGNARQLGAYCRRPAPGQLSGGDAVTGSR
jgi:hypothetical protein